ncbi:MAG: NB-ARC domain-containing protein [Verrucomicrobiales bacterium]|nr:NB-ARC domain-containing protein [Verrucomicrobiales bacterium]
MSHKAIEQVLQRAEAEKEESDFAYFFSLLLSAEALTKTIVSGMIAAVGDDAERNRYRIEHALIRADGIGDWCECLEDVLTGAASQYLLNEARAEHSDLIKKCKEGDWQHDATTALKDVLDSLGITSEEVPVKTDLKRWFRLFAQLRNKTRAHGATRSGSAGIAALHLQKSIALIYENFSLFNRQWAHLHRNISGKYRVSSVTGNTFDFDYLKTSHTENFNNGIYIYFDSPREVRLIESDPELDDFYFANGGLRSQAYELLSYVSDNRKTGDGSQFLTPPGKLPNSETEGHGELLQQGNCFSNAPEGLIGYISRTELESELKQLLLDDRREVVTLVGRGGIGKTSLALRVIQDLFDQDRYEVIVWFSARDVDLGPNGPKSVKANVFTIDDLVKLYSNLVFFKESADSKKIKPREFFESQLQNCQMGNCLFVFDNFETMQNPGEVFKWIDTYIRLPNKVLITTRLREFKGDYPVEVSGMNAVESNQLIMKTAKHLEISNLLSDKYVTELVTKSEGHPYIIKILLGEVSRERKALNIPRIVAGTEDVLTALFERTYAILSPCGQRAFLTLSAWNSPVPKIALEAVLIRSTEQRSEVELGIESLIQFSIAEEHSSEVDGQIFISLPLVASVFGKKKLNINPSKAAIKSDVETLQMLGPMSTSDLNVGLVNRLERMIQNISRKVEDGEEFTEYESILEAICRAYNPGWLLLARWHMESRTQDGYEKAKIELKRFLENSNTVDETSEAWQLLGHACYQTNDDLGEVHAFVERSQIGMVSYYDLSNTANRLNLFIRQNPTNLEEDEKREMAAKIANVMKDRKSEASGNDFSRMAWLEIHRGQETAARELVSEGLRLDPNNYHLGKLSQRFDTM